MTTPATSSRRSLLAGVAVATAGFAGCNALQGSSESYECMGVSLRGGSIEYRMTLEYGTEDGQRERRRVTGSTTSETTIYTPRDCEYDSVDEELPTLTPPITATAELAALSDVGPDDPVTFALELDDEVVGRTEITEIGSKVTLEHRP